MELIFVKEYKLKLLSFYGVLSQAIPLILMVYIVPYNILIIPKFLWLLIFLFFLNRYPHEYLHKFGGFLSGIKSKINFKKINACCIFEGYLNNKELLIAALFPFVVLTFFYILIILVSYNMFGDFIFYLLVAALIFSLPSYAGDFAYVYHALKYKDHLFHDLGDRLRIYKKVK